MADVSGNPDRSVLAIDQFEEVFTLCTDAAERGTFLDLIADAALDSDGSVTVLLAMRADYYGRCAEHRALASLLEKSQTLVGPMTEDELKRAIEQPAERAGLEVDPELTDALVGDVAGRAGGLPLLSTALLELWTRRRGRSLVLDEYLRSGGVEGAVGRLAEDAFTRLDHDGQDAARRILTRLADWGDGGEIVGRRTSLDEFDLGYDQDISRAMDALVQARLITVAEGSVEVAHEALLREWPRLREWFEADAEGRRIHRRIADSARSWAEEGRDEAGLLRGARLGAALEWADAHAGDPNELEREFLARSRTASEGEVARTRRTNRLLRGLLAGVALLLALSLVVGSLAIAQRNDARELAAVADARRLAARSLVEEDAGLALVLAREAVHIYDAPETRSALFSTLIRAPAIFGRMYAPGGPSPFGDQDQWIEISPDGDTIAIGDSGPSVAFFDADQRVMLGAFPIESGTTRATFSPDGETLAIVTLEILTPANDTIPSEIVAVDVPSLTERARAESRGLSVDAIEYIDGGATVLSAELFDGGAFLISRDPETLEPSGPRVLAHDPRVAGMATSSDGRWLVTTSVDSDDQRGIQPGSGETTLWDAGSLRPIRSFQESADDSPLNAASTDVALSPDGSVAALIDNRFEAIPEVGSIAFLDLRSGAVRQGQGGHQGAGGTQWETTGVAFTPDGRSVVTTGNDSQALIWDVRSATVRDSFFAGTDQQIRGPALSADGTTLYTTDRTREVILWDLLGARGLARPFDAGEGCAGWPYFAMTRDGRRLATMQCRDPGSSNGSVDVIDTSDLTSIREIPYPGSVPQGVAFSPDGRMLAVGSWTWDGNRGHVRLWDPESGRPVGPDLPGLSSGVAVWTLEFSPDGRTLAGGAQVGDDQTGRIQFWDVITQTPLEAALDLPTPVNDLTSTPDGNSLVAVTAIAEGGDIVYWDWASRRVRETIHADDLGVWSSDISNDGRVLATGGQGSSVRLWDVASGDDVGLPLSGLEDTAAVVDVSSDGRTVLAASTRGEVLMWDASSGTILASFPGVELESSAAAAFSPDGRSVIIVSDVGSGWVWDVEPRVWADRACDIAGRSLTRAEWQHFLPTLPYHATCGS
jgi:WD40 repeat protein